VFRDGQVTQYSLTEENHKHFFPSVHGWAQIPFARYEAFISYEARLSLFYVTGVSKKFKAFITPNILKRKFVAMLPWSHRQSSRSNYNKPKFNTDLLSELTHTISAIFREFPCAWRF
jgi:hypothetical protein